MMRALWNALHHRLDRVQRVDARPRRQPRHAAWKCRSHTRAHTDQMVARVVPLKCLYHTTRICSLYVLYSYCFPASHHSNHFPAYFTFTYNTRGTLPSADPVNEVHRLQPPQSPTLIAADVHVWVHARTRTRKLRCTDHILAGCCSSLGSL